MRLLLRKRGDGYLSAQEHESTTEQTRGCETHGEAAVDLKNGVKTIRMVITIHKETGSVS